MSVNLPDLIGKAKIDTSQAKASLNELKVAAADTGRATAASAEAGAAGFAKLGAAGYAAVGGVAALAAGVFALGTALNGAAREFAKAGSELSDLKNQTGIGVVEMQKLQYAAKQTGVDTGALTSALVKMENAASKTPEKFAQLGISMAELKASSPIEILQHMSDSFKKIESDSDRTRVAMEIFGKGGSQMLKLLMDDFGGLTKAAEATGLMTEEMASKGDRLDDAIIKLDGTMKNLKVNMAAALASPQMISLLEKTADLIGFMARHAEELAHALSDSIPGFGLLVRLAELQSQSGGGDGGYRQNSGLGDFDGVSGGTSGASGKIDIADYKAHQQMVAQREKDDLKAADDHIKNKEKEFAEEQRLEESAFKDHLEYVKRREQADLAAGDDHVRRVTQEFDDQQKAQEAFVAARTASDEAAGDEHVRRVEQEFEEELKAQEAFIAARTAADDAAGDDHVRRVIEQNKLAREAVIEGWHQFSDDVRGVMGLMEALGVSSESTMMKVASSVADAADLVAKATERGYYTIGDLAQAGTGIYKSGSALGGIASGAMIGNSIAPGGLGALIGGAAGGILGLFGGKAKAKAELADLKSQLSGLSDEAKLFGINLDAAFASKNAGTVKAAIDAVNDAMKARDARMEAAPKFAAGLNEWTTNGGITDQASQDRAGRYAVASFAGQVKDSGDIFGALDSVAPSLEAMAKAAAEMGLELPKSVAALMQLNGLDDSIKGQVSGLNMMAKSIEDAGLSSQTMFDDLGADALATKAKLEETGLSGNQSLSLMQPTLQKLYEMQKLHGYAVDESTQALIDEAKAQGIVGDEFMSANERMVELLGILIEAVGGTLPEAYKKAGAAADEYGNKARTAVGGGVPGGGGGKGSQNSGDDPPEETPGFAGGTSFRNFGSGTQVTLHGDEAVMTRPQVDRLVGMAVAGGGGPMIPPPGSSGGGAGRPIVINLHADGRLLTQVVTNTLAAEGPEAQALRVAYRGRQ